MLLVRRTERAGGDTRGAQTGRGEATCLCDGAEQRRGAAERDGAVRLAEAPQRGREEAVQVLRAAQVSGRSCQFLRGLAEASAARMPQRCTATHRLCIHVRVRYLRHADAEQFHERAREQEADVL